MLKLNVLVFVIEDEDFNMCVAVMAGHTQTNVWQGTQELESGIWVNVDAAAGRAALEVTSNEDYDFDYDFNVFGEE